MFSIFGVLLVFATLYVCYLHFESLAKSGKITNDDNLLIFGHAFATVLICALVGSLYFSVFGT